MNDEYPKFKAAAVQATPDFLNREGTVLKACKLIKEAGQNGADLVAFPEAFIPGYPHWIWLDHPRARKGYSYFRKLYKNTVKVPSESTDKLCQAAKDANAYVVIGINETDPIRVGTIYNTSLIIDRRGKIMGKHRKIVPTQAERLVWGRGDGSTLKVYDTDCGRLGVLLCGENTNILARFALLAQGEQVHVASYPAPFVENYNRTIEIRARAHAFEGKIFVMTSSIYLSEEIKEELGDTEEKRKMLSIKNNALTTIYGPAGEPITDVLTDKEGIVYADIDLEEMIEAKLLHDIVGHYNRFDVLSLNLNRQENVPIKEVVTNRGKSIDTELYDKLSELSEYLSSIKALYSKVSESRNEGEGPAKDGV